MEQYSATTQQEMEMMEVLNLQNHGENRLQKVGAKREKVRIPPMQCPRCNSWNTKFCYYNNNSAAQLRFYCKACKRYWTQGGSLRDIPVGGTSRKDKKSHKKDSSGVDPSTNPFSVEVTAGCGPFSSLKIEEAGTAFTSQLACTAYFQSAHSPSGATVSAVPEIQPSSQLNDTYSSDFTLLDDFGHPSYDLLQQQLQQSKQEQSHCSRAVYIDAIHNSTDQCFPILESKTLLDMNSITPDTLQQSFTDNNSWILYNDIDLP